MIRSRVCHLNYANFLAAKLFKLFKLFGGNLRPYLMTLDSRDGARFKELNKTNKMVGLKLLYYALYEPHHGYLKSSNKALNCRQKVRIMGGTNSKQNHSRKLNRITKSSDHFDPLSDLPV